MAQGLVRSNVFGLQLSTYGGELVLGGTNRNLYQGNVEMHTGALPFPFTLMRADAGHCSERPWVVYVESSACRRCSDDGGATGVLSSGSISRNGQTIASGFQTVIDSGTTLIYAPPDVARQLHSSIPGAYELSAGEWAVPCNSMPTFSFSWEGGRQVRLPSLMTKSIRDS